MTSHAWGRRALVFAALLAMAVAVSAQTGIDIAGQDYAAAALAFNSGLDEMAVSAFVDFLKKHPADKRVPNARYALGVSFFRLKKYTDADKQLALVVGDKAYANRATALYFQGQARRAAGKFAEAAAAFNLLAADYPTHKLADKAAVGAGEALYFGGKFAEAAKALAEMPTKFPKSPLLNHAIFIRGLSLYEAKDYAAAATVLDDSLKRDPKGEQAPQVAYLLGSCREQTAKKPEEFAAALAAYKLSYAHLNKSPYADDAMYRAAFLMSKLPKKADLPGAINLLETLAKTKSELADTARLNAGQFAIQAKDYVRAVALLKPLEAKIDPKTKIKSDLADDAAYFHGKALLAGGKFPEAVVQLDKAAKYKNATYAAEVLFEGGVAQLKVKQFADARKRFERFVATYAAKKHTLTNDAMFNAAAAAFGTKDYAGSRTWCAKLLAAKPRAQLVADSSFMKAQCEQQQGDFKNAAVTFATFAAANRRHPKVNLAWLQCGIAQYRTKQFTEAMVSFNRIPLMVRSRAPFNDSLFLAGDCSYNLGDFAAAVARLRSYKQFAPTGAYADICLLKLGLALQNLKQYPEALAAFSEVRSAFAKSKYVAQATFEVGQCHASLAKPNHAEAAKAFALVAAMTTPDAQRFTAKATYNLGWAKMQTARHAEAAAAFAKLADKFPADELAGESELLAGICYDEAGDLANAETRLNAYVTKHAGDKQIFKGMVRLASVLGKRKKHAEAAAVLEKVTADSRFAAETALDTALYDLAWSYRSVTPAQTAKAEASYRALLGRFPKSELADNSAVELSQILFDKKKRDAGGVVALLEPVAAGTIDPPLADAVHYMLGWCLFEQEKWAPAASHLMKVATTKGAKNAAVSAYQAGEAFTKLGTFEKAAAAYGILFSRHPTHELADAAGLRQGEGLSKSGDYAGAAAVLTAVLTKFPKSKYLAEIHFARGWAYENLSNKGDAAARDKALADYGKVVGLTQAEVAARARFQTGEILAAAGKYDQAVVELLKVSVYPFPKWSSPATLEMGRIFEATNKPARAIRMYQQVIDRYPGTPQADVAKQRLAALKG